MISIPDFNNIEGENKTISSGSDIFNIKIIQKGNGISPKLGDTVKIHYIGTFKNGQ
jgi:FKBP-type peptidyl-prolyl cis-trans isomerase